ncbi:MULTISPECIES: PD-(D/E)XK nuclease family protein [Acinetobacter]|uniref:PD-(D/E)XK nuclease family protein n=1 Tax=Acinetobacter TaxID=469 RepID=UPI000CFEF442|nr:PD-(D/E)XK nuclease family protein [Acinetobacter sp. MYb10]QLD63275.1 PD-(D/E)XK nuclease family protein [Acinetobacter sp. MYb10]
MFLSKKEQFGRIDLIIEADPYLFVVENKIRHKINNPFHVYKSYIEKNYQKYEFSKVYYLILGIEKPKSKTGVFKFVSHFDLLSQIDKLKADKGVEITYLTPFINDYFDAMMNLKRNKNMNYDEERVLKFCINNVDKLDELQKFKEISLNYLDEKLRKNIENLYQEKFDVKNILTDKGGNWNDLTKYINSEYIYVQNWVLEIQILYRLKEVSVFLTPYTKRHKKPLEDESYQYFLDYLKAKKINVICEYALGNVRYVQVFEFPLGESVNKISKAINGIIEKISP